MSKTIDYKAFIEDNFYIKSKEGEIVPFIFNEVQSKWYQDLLDDYPDMQGIRENDLKGRQFGLSSVISGIFTVDFILSGLGSIPLVDSDIYSHKDSETTSHFNRVNMFFDSWALKTQGKDYRDNNDRMEAPKLRGQFLKIDTTNLLVAKNGAQIQTQTASAKVSGRGSTKQNIHWSEVAFYPSTQIMNAETLVTGAEEQVPSGFGKIFRETTGNLAGDYFAIEYQKGKEGLSDFKSRFMAWYLHKPYSTFAPNEWQAPEYYETLLTDGLATKDQCYWHFNKTRGLTDKKRLREYPTYDTEAFLYGGDPFFDADALLYYTNMVVKPIKRSLYVQSL